MEPCSNRWTFNQDQEERKTDFQQLSQAPKDKIRQKLNPIAMLNEQNDKNNASDDMSPENNPSPKGKENAGDPSETLNTLKNIFMDKTTKARTGLASEHLSTQKLARRLKMSQRRKERLHSKLLKESGSDKDKERAEERPAYRRLGEKNSMSNERTKKTNTEPSTQQWPFSRHFLTALRPPQEAQEENKEDLMHPSHKEKDEKSEPDSETEMSVCAYCFKNFPQGQIGAHEDACDMKKIPCEECGERILMDVYDFHVEECKNTPRMPRRPENTRALDLIHSFFAIDMRFRGFENPNPNPNPNPTHQGNLFHPMGSFGGFPFGIPFVRQNTNRLETYEELLALDENKVEVGLTAEELDKFSTRCWKKEKETEIKERCNICLGEFEEGEVLRQLMCQHEYHKGCIDTWLGKNLTCPYCKKYMK